MSRSSSCLLLKPRMRLVSILEGVKTVDVIRKPIDRKHFIQKVKASIESAHSGTNN